MENKFRYFRIIIGWIIRVIGKLIQPKYWICSNCNNLEYYERELFCWKCSVGEMLYKGEFRKRNNNEKKKT